MSRLPAFQTERLSLRPRSVSDLEACLAMDRDPEVNRFLELLWQDPATHRAFVLQRMNAAYPAGMGYWSVLEAGSFIGWILLIPLDLHGPEIEIGWRLVRAAWGRGYATEAARPVLDHGLGTIGLQQVIAEIDPRNASSRGVASKLGMRLVGPVRGGALLRHAIEQRPRFTPSDDSAPSHPAPGMAGTLPRN